MAINWNMPGPQNNALAYFQFGNQLGTQARERQQEREGKNALAAYVADPSDGNFAKVAQYDPRTAIAMRRDQQAQSAAQEKALQEKAKAAQSYIAESAFQIVQLPPEQRAQAWDAYIDQGSENFPGLAQYRGKYTPEALNSIVAQAGQMQEFQQFQQPRYVPVGDAGLQGLQYGVPIGTGATPGIYDPADGEGVPDPQPIVPGAQRQNGAFTFDQYRGAVNGLGKQGADAMLQRNRFRVSVRTPDEARMLPSGTDIILPDGTEGRVP